MKKNILNIRKVITKEKKTYITKWYEGTLLTGDQFLGLIELKLARN